jgi:hypothetical protein
MIIAINGRQGAGKDTLGMILQALTMERKGRWYEDPLGYAKGYEGTPNLKGGWRIVKFADKLKEIASILTGIPRAHFEQQELKLTTLGPEWDTWRVYFADGKQYGHDFVTEEEAHKWIANERMALQWPKRVITKVIKVQMTVREFLQRLGTEGLRNGLHSNTWVNALFADYKPTKKEGGFQRIVKSGGIPVDFQYEVEYPNWIITDMRFPNEFEEVKRRNGFTVRIDRPNNPHKQSEHISETALDSHKFDIRFDNQVGLEGLVTQAKAILTIEGLRTWR